MVEGAAFFDPTGYMEWLFFYRSYLQVLAQRKNGMSIPVKTIISLTSAHQNRRVRLNTRRRSKIAPNHRLLNSTFQKNI